MLRRSLTLLIVLRLSLSASPSFAQPRLTQDATVSASGVVLLTPDERPVRHAHVELLNMSAGLAASTLTDDDGGFRLTGLLPGSYRVTVTAPGCERLEDSMIVDGSGNIWFLRLHKTQKSATPRNDSVVTVEEFRLSGKAESAFAKGTRMLQHGDAQGSLYYFRHALARDRGYYRAYHNLGLANYQLG